MLIINNNFSIIKRIMLEIQTFLQNVLQNVYMVSDY